MLNNGSYTYTYFFWILSPIKIKLVKILVCYLKNISNMFLAQSWWLETTSRPFYGLIKTTIARDLAIFNSWHLPFLSVPDSHIFKKIKHGNLDIIGYWVIWAGCLLKRACNLAQILKIVQKILENYCLYLHLSIDQVWWLNELWFKR